MRAPAVASLGLGLGLAAVAAPSARADDMPTGRISGQAGLQASTGAFAARLGAGWAFGFEAAYQPLRPDQSIGLALSWFTTWSYYGSGSARIADQLAMLQLGAGARVRVPLGVRRRQVLFLGGGVAMIRLNEPPVEDGDRSYLGPWATAGVEGMVGPVQLGVEARYVVTGSDDGTLGLLLSLGFGS